jgi:hypothetical protein
MKYFELQNNTIFGYSDLTVRPFTVFNSDSESLFAESLKTQPEDWIYRTKKIIYERNEFGHRAVPLHSLPDDFILTTGCSFTEGIGLATEDIFPTLVANAYGIGCYNLALASSGPDLIYENLMLWFRNIKKNPKYVIIQHTFPDRAYIPKNKGILPLGPWFPRIPKGLLEDSEKSKFEYLVNSNFCEHYFNIMRNMFNLYMKSLGIPVIEISPDGFTVAGAHATFRTLDYARDLKHPGIKSHREIASQVVQAIGANSSL